MKQHLVRTCVLALAFCGNAFAAAPTNIPAGDYTLDKAHASLTFRLTHMGFSHYTAQFGQFDAKLKFDPAHPETSQIDATIDPKSLTLSNPPEGFVAELTGKNWLDAATFPQMTFHSTKVVVTGQTAKITGDFTLHGVTKPVVLDATFNGGYAGLPTMDPHARVGFSAHTVFKRSDFGVAYGIPKPGTTMGVSDEVEVNIEAEFSGPALAGDAK